MRIAYYVLPNACCVNDCHSLRLLITNYSSLITL